MPNDFIVFLVLERVYKRLEKLLFYQSYYHFIIIIFVFLNFICLNYIILIVDIKGYEIIAFFNHILPNFVLLFALTC